MRCCDATISYIRIIYFVCMNCVNKYKQDYDTNKDAGRRWNEMARGRARRGTMQYKQQTKQINTKHRLREREDTDKRTSNIILHLVYSRGKKYAGSLRRVTVNRRDCKYCMYARVPRHRDYCLALHIDKNKIYVRY